MRITGTRLLLAFAIALVAQGGVFAWVYSDLLYLHQPVPAITGGKATTFKTYATEALARPHVTREHLDTITTAASAFGSVDLEIRALERWTELEPSNTTVTLRLADLLQQAGQHERAETLYQQVLKDGKGGSR